MPSYKAPHHGAELSEAQHEAAVIAPAQRPMLHCFELYHPIGTPDGPIYTVNDLESFDAAKEAGASRDAGETVTFMAAQITLTEPEESDTEGNPQITLSVTNVSGLMSDALRSARGSLVPWELIERVYAADDPSGPATLQPLLVYMTSVVIAGDVLTVTASLGDSGNVSVPRLTFRRPQYPGLVR